MNDGIEQKTRTNVSNRLFGSFPAKIVSTEHPKNLYMASVRLLGLWDAVPDEALPFAEFLLPLGARLNHGEVSPVEPGDLVWIDFPRMGDTRYPRILGSLYHAPNFESQLPSEINATAYEPVRAENEPIPPAYNRKDYLYDKHGLREHRTALGGFSITHKGSGSTIEITEKGEIVIHVEGDSYRSTTGDLLEQISSNLTIKVSGNATIESEGDAVVKAGGSATVEGSSIGIVSEGELTIEAGGALSIEAGGAFNVKATNADFKLG